MKNSVLAIANQILDDDCPPILMGACSGHCLNTTTNFFFRRSYSKHTNALDDAGEQDEFGTSPNNSLNHQISHSNSSKKILSLFSLKRFKQTCRVPVALELIEDPGWNNYKRLSNENASNGSGLDNPLQVLDASGLLINQECLSFTPTSSIDLEWENEEIPGPVIEKTKLKMLDESLSEPTGNNSHPPSFTASPWSQISTPNSLEWDPVEADNEDFETDKLLTEIERLTNRALEETAEWVNSN